MLTTTRAIVLAGMLVFLAACVHVLFPRYEIRTINARGTFVRIDRWRGTADVTETRVPGAPWLTINGVHRVTADDIVGLAQ